MIQGSPEWFAARCGNVTASRISDIVAQTKSGYAASRANYMSQLLCERLTGTVEESFQNEAMKWGTMQEPFARAAYEALNNLFVDEVGYIPHPVIEHAGASPDGLVRLDGMIEIKCKSTANHIETILSGKVPKNHYDQMQWQIACTGRDWCDYVCYDPRMPHEHLKLFVKQVVRDDKYIAELEREVIKFLGELQSKIDSLLSQL